MADTNVRTEGLSAAFVRQSVPTKMKPGKAYEVSVTMRNTGTGPWLPNLERPIRLGSQNPQDNTTWGVSRCELPDLIAPGEDVTFVLQIKAPALGKYAFQWRMLQELVEWFGAPSENVEVLVE